MSELKVIYLGPACQENGDGREWCQDDVWERCECGHRPVQYVLCEDFDRVVAERDALQQRLNAADQRIDELTGTSTDRTPKDYAIEHAEYMAKSADHVLAEFHAYGLALLAVDEGGDDGEGELFEAIDSARQDLQEALVNLRGMVFEFRKRASKIPKQ